ncbi:hypothetical protein [Halarcobacter sp.]|uniref:hypothetical protein n=1 Tax=Halarcobacter sp. TaxID=2321133 RepID=UPI002AAAF142|nr:hypothetical protein [Halarcobacter sp.]
MYGNELILDLEKKLAFYSHKIEEKPIDDISFKLQNLIEIILNLYDKKNILKDIKSFNKKYNDNLEIESNKLKYNPNYFSKIGISLFEKLYFEKKQNKFKLWLDIIDKCFHKYSFGNGLWYWINEVSKINEIKEEFLNEITKYIIENKISKEQWYLKLKLSYENKPNYVRYFDIENTPRKFTTLFDIYSYFKEEKKNEFLFEYIAKDIRSSLTYCLIKNEETKSYFYNQNSYQRINKILEECEDDYLIISEILTTENIRFNTYLLSHPKYYIYGFLNILKMNYFPYNLNAENEDYAKIWIDMISSQILDILFNNFKNKIIENKDKLNFFNLLNTITLWHYKYSYSYIISISLENFLNKITTYKNSNEIIFNKIIKVLIDKQIKDINKKNDFDITNYFLFSLYLEKIDYFEKVLDIDYSEEKLKITKAIYENIKKIFTQSIKNKSFHIYSNEMKKINFSIFYNASSNIIKNKWLDLLDLNILKEDMQSDDNFYVSDLIRFYINILISIYEKKPSLKLEKLLVDLITKFGFEERLGIFFFEEKYKIFDSFSKIVNIFSKEGYKYFLDNFLKFNDIKTYLQLYSTAQSTTKKEYIKEKIDLLNLDNFSSYPDIEESINYALNEGLNDISNKLINIYEKMVGEKQSLQEEKKYKFKTVKYKKDLIDICFSKETKKEKLEKINHLTLPKLKKSKIKINEINLAEYKTFITALIYIHHDEPLKGFNILKELCDKSLNELYLNHLLRAYYNAYKDDLNKKEKFEYILKLYNEYDSKINYEKNLFDYQVLLSIYNSINDVKCFNKLWEETPDTYKFNMYIVEIRYKFLQSNNQHTEALEFINHVKKYHGTLSKEDKSTIVNLEKNITNKIEQDLSNYITIDKPNSLDKGTAEEYWRKIKDMKDDEHSYIFGKSSLEEYIKNIILSISKEVLDRKKYLIYKDKLVDENTITDWFCSLLRERQRFVGWHFSNDRGSYSATGKKAGERDLVIRNANNDIICIIEAFKQEGLNTTTIKSHLNKLNNYNGSGIKLFINLIYYKHKTKSFSIFTEEYKNNITNLQYDGFDKIILPQPIIKEENKSTNITLFKENRQKNQNDTVIYHFLLDFN